MPCQTANYIKTDWGSSYTVTSYDSTIETKELQQITTYGGFYVARYEAGSSNVTLTNGGKIGDTQLSASGWQNNSYVAGKKQQEIASQQVKKVKYHIIMQTMEQQW